MLWGAARAALLLIAATACGPGASDLEGTALVARGSPWKLATDAALAEPSPGRTPPFATHALDDSDWPVVPTPLGFDQDGLRHEIAVDENGQPLVIFLRQHFELADPAAFDGLVLELLADDGARVYLNGQEVARSNLPGGWQIDASTRGVMSVAGEAEEEYVRLGLPAEALRAGDNVLAVSLHNTRPGSDLIFDAALVAQGPGDPAAVIRGPYLQQVTAGGARVRFETSRPVTGVVRYGSAADALGTEARSKEPGRSHDIALSELLSGTDYAYRVDALDGPQSAMDGPGPVGRFRTAPRTGSRAPFRVWVTGDPGTGSKHARAARDGFAAFSKERPAQLWLTLGDNAYPSGTPMDWQARFFDIYPAQLAALPLFPTLGNHDANAVSPQSGAIHYFEALTLPTRAEAGGSPSGSEHFYSFDWGNVHFIALDSDQSNRRNDAAMARWLRLDLLHTQADWKVAYLHHAPFSRGTHHDDSEQRSRQMREHFVPMLEQAGVDLVLSGHSHAYERSHWLAGPHPPGFPYDPAQVLAQAEPVDGIDLYASKPGSPRGTVYVVAGSAGQIGRNSPLDHPAMAHSEETHGSLVIDVEACRLETRFVGEEGSVLDAFAIEKEDRLGRCHGGPPAARATAAAAPGPAGHSAPTLAPAH